ncbi:PurD Phosphoribosylamine-glycine ligase [uncultured Caudovirales phage]|uniref:phosphoribosylamine--glycine ligase n=1 Tax=uncultured Caudovirales phage TaxID=2100421 RepID=A0A6J5PE76_9CAUD|nr:PurD Phosphoribosylamine-glycine ligase [uncultured Caudovirales phage]
MKILLIDAGGVCLDFAMRCMAYGHTVKAYIRNNKDGSRSMVGDGGLLTRVPDWEPHMNWADLIFCTDNTYYIHQLERYRDKGYPIIGPSIDTNRWEQDRQHGAEIFERAGIPVIPSTEFKSYDEAISFVIKNNKRYVSKPLGDGDKALSYVAKSSADMVFMLQKWKKSNAYKGSFILQEFHGGIEIAVGGWFGMNGFSKQLCINHEFKKLLAGDLGVSTGEEGTILYYVQDSLLADKVLKPLEGYLKGLRYTGYIDVNCIIDDKGKPWPLEFTMRPGWPLFMIQQSLHKGDPAQWMLDLLDGKDTLRVSTDIACGVVISMPPYPFDKGTPKKESAGYPMFDLTMEDVIKNVHLAEVMCAKAPAMVDGKVKLNEEQFVTAGNYVCIVTGTGETVEDAREHCYGTVKKKIHIPNSIGYRTDIGCRLEEQLPELKKMGYCNKKYR